MNLNFSRRDASRVQSIRHAVRGLTFRAATEAELPKGIIGALSGHAAVFNSDSVEFAGWEKPWVERIAPGAFKRTLTEQPDIFALAQHETNGTIARSPETLSLSEDDKGLAFEIRLVDTQLNRDVRTLVQNRILDSMSFGFAPRSTKWEEGKERDVRTLVDVDLFEISVVTWPAYPAASVGARKSPLPTEEVEAIRAERESFFKSVRGNMQPTVSQSLMRVWEQRVRFM